MTVPSPIADLVEFIEKSPTAWHAVEQAIKRLEKAGFRRLEEKDPWKLDPGGKYYVSRNGSSLCTFILPEQTPQKASILAAHTDSPALKLKPNPEFRVQNYLMWGIEPYGEPLLSSWLNRDLGLAGRVVMRHPSEGTIQKLVCIDDAPVIIPQLAIHLDRDANDKGFVLNRQEHLSAIAAMASESIEAGSYLSKMLRDRCGGHPISAADLLLFPLEKPRFCSNNQELLSAYRLDNLASTHSCLLALTSHQEAAPHLLKMAILWDNEEVGSRTAQGADSPFLQHVLERITCLLDMPREGLFRLYAQSLCVSVDLAHAINPNYPAKHEPHHQVQLGAGVVLKVHSNQRYATDAVSASLISEICRSQQIPLQTFASRSDIPCGSTVGPINAARTGIKTVDIGCPQLSMHSSRETICCKDQLAMNQLLHAVLQGFD